MQYPFIVVTWKLSLLSWSFNFNQTHPDSDTESNNSKWSCWSMKPMYPYTVLYYSYIVCGRSIENFRFWLFYIDLVTKSYKTSNPKAMLQGLLYFYRTTNCMLNSQIFVYQSKVHLFQLSGDFFFWHNLNLCPFE